MEDSEACPPELPLSFFFRSLFSRYIYEYFRLYVLGEEFSRREASWWRAYPVAVKRQALAVPLLQQLKKGQLIIMLMVNSSKINK